MADHGSPQKASTLPVALFWDYENIRIPPALSANGAVSLLRTQALLYGGHLVSIKAYMDTSLEASAKNTSLRSELQCSGVSIIDTSHNGGKEVADKMTLIDLMSFALNTKAPATIILVSGDKDFAYALSTLRNRRYKIVVITSENASPSLRSQADEVLDWRTEVLNMAPQQPGTTKDKPKSKKRSAASANLADQGHDPYSYNPFAQSGPSAASTSGPFAYPPHSCLAPAPTAAKTPVHQKQVPTEPFTHGRRVLLLHSRPCPCPRRPRRLPPVPPPHASGSSNYASGSHFHAHSNLDPMRALDGARLAPPGPSSARVWTHSKGGGKAGETMKRVAASGGVARKFEDGWEYIVSTAASGSTSSPKGAGVKGKGKAAREVIEISDSEDEKEAAAVVESRKKRKEERKRRKLEEELEAKLEEELQALVPAPEPATSDMDCEETPGPEWPTVVLDDDDEGEDCLTGEDDGVERDDAEVVVELLQGRGVAPKGE